MGVVVATVAADNTGYFWHISDLHLDPNYWERDGSCRKGKRSNELGQFGDHSCDAPWALLQSAVQMMNQEHGDNLMFILWTGDAISESVKDEEEKYEALRNVTDLLARGFPSDFVFPVLGETDPVDYHRLWELWKQWLPDEAKLTFNKGGFYCIEQKKRKLKVVVLNTNLWTREDGGDPGGQWAWLEEELLKAESNQKTIYLVGHIAPGYDERQGAPARLSLAEPHNSRYISLISKHAQIITGQFFGHLHSDTFRIVYGASGEPVSTLFLAPSLTPKLTPSGANNPALRLYKIDSERGDVYDYTQYYLDLDLANTSGEDNWTVEYNFTRYYGLVEVSPAELNDLAQMFTTDEGVKLFGRYWVANSVSTYDMPVKGTWKTAQYCAITQLDYSQYHSCVDQRTSALAASREAVSGGASSLSIGLLTSLLTSLITSLLSAALLAR